METEETDKDSINKQKHVDFKEESVDHGEGNNNDSQQNEENKSTEQFEQMENGDEGTVDNESNKTVSEEHFDNRQSCDGPPPDDVIYDEEFE